jgi:tetratricopeptide (TPR) repeat protein
MAEDVRATEPDFFVSYTQADRSWAEWIAWQLEAAGYSTVLQAWDFVPGSDWAFEMQRATATAGRTIAVLSSSYLRSVFGQAEWQAAFSIDPTGERGRLVPVRVELVEAPGLLRTRVYVDLVGTSPETARARLLNGIRRGRAKPESEPPFPEPWVSGPGATDAPRFPGRHPEITNLPPRNPNFTGRAELIGRLRAELHASAGIAVTQARAIPGLGGVGKTELMLEYAHRYAAEYDVIWWLPAARVATALSSLAALARRLGIQEQADQGKMVGELFAELRRRSRWLLLYDDAEGPGQLRALLPPGGDGHVLVSSRYRAWGRVAQPLPLGVFRRQESVAFLRRRTGSEDGRSAAALAQFLGDLPLALEEAAAYVEETQVGLGEYLRLARDRTVELFELDQPVGDEQRVSTTWSVSLDRVRAEAPAAEALLELCAFFAPEAIPRELPSIEPDRLPMPLSQAVRDPLAYNEAIRALGRYSLATVTPEAIGVHLLVQAVIRARLGRDGERRWAEAAVDLLSDSFPDRSWEVAAWETCQRLLPHVLAASEHAQRLEVAGEAAGWLLDRAAAYLRGRGQPRQARPIAERALAVTEAALGPDDPETGERHDGLGRVLRDLGDLDGARAELERALAIFVAADGPDHPDVAILRSTLAQVQRDLGDVAGAWTELERALAIFEATMGPDHQEVGGVRNELAHLLWVRGDLVGARAQLERALVIFEANLGPDDPAVATVHSNLGSVLQDLRDLPAARAQLEQALNIFVSAMGPDHPEVATARSKLGGVLRDLGDLQGARTELEGALATLQSAYGPDHPNVGILCANLGAVLRDLGDLEGAKVQLERALASFQTVVGADHPNVAILRGNLQRVLNELAGGADARPATG